MRYLAARLFAVTILLAGCSPASSSGRNPESREGTSGASVAPIAQAEEANAAFDPDQVPQAAFSPASIAGMTKMTDRAWVKTAVLWKQPGAITVCWEPGAESYATEKAWVKDAVGRSWDAASEVVKFVGWGTCGQNARGIRIRVKEDGPRTLGLGNSLDGVRDGMLLNFTFATWRRSCADAAKRERCIREVAVHEFGHALGFAHEQNRWDTPGECEQPAQGSMGDKILTPWDKDSEMNYCNGSADGVLSPLDVSGLRQAYPRVG